MDGQPDRRLRQEWPLGVRERISEACDTCVASSDADGGGVALVTARGVRETLYASDEISLAVETLQLDLAEGPCVDAASTGAPVMIADMNDPRERAHQRWPFFQPPVNALGVSALFAFPLRIGSVVLGTLELYRLTAGLLDSAGLSTALRSSDDLGHTILDLSHPDIGPLAPSGAFVHQAAGMVMVQLDSTIDEAMAYLRARAFVDGIPLADLSADVVRGRRNFRKE